MDFEVQMQRTPMFDELVAEFRPSVGDFKFCQKLGGEEDCQVFKCLYEGGKFALKTVLLKDSCIMEPREVEVISSLNDKRVMAFYQSILDRWYLFEEMVKGVKTIHDELIVHRDLKPDNIFFGSDMGVRIGDFGDACIGRDEFGGYGGTPGLGTENYSAPELQIAQKITEKADIYPTGVMFIEIFTTFQTVSGKHKLLGGLRDKGLPDYWVGDLGGDREGTRGLVERLIANEPAYRPSAEEILDYIQQ